MEKIYSQNIFYTYFPYKSENSPIYIRQHVFDNYLKYILMTPKYIFVAKSCVYRICFYWGNETNKSERMSERESCLEWISGAVAYSIPAPWRSRCLYHWTWVETFKFKSLIFFIVPANLKKLIQTLLRFTRSSYLLFKKSIIINVLLPILFYNDYTYILSQSAIKSTS